MSHAEALQTLHPAVGATEAIVEFVSELRHAALTDEVRHYARRHLLDTVGVMIAGAGGEVATRAEAVLSAVRPAGRIPVPGRARRADLHRRRLPRRHRGAWHRARRRLPPGLGASAAASWCRRCSRSATTGAITGAALIEAVVAGYESRDRDRRAPAIPTCASADSIRPAAVGVFGAAWRPASCAALSAAQLANALGIAASSAAGLFAFVNGGADIKRLHAGHASREGLQAALLAEQGVEGPPDVIEARDGFMQAFAFGRDRQGARRSCCRRRCRSASPTATSSPIRAAATSSPRSRR